MAKHRRCSLRQHHLGLLVRRPQKVVTTIRFQGRQNQTDQDRSGSSFSRVVRREGGTLLSFPVTQADNVQVPQGFHLYQWRAERARDRH